MNRRQLLVQQQFLNNEGAVLKRLKSVYNQAAKDVNAKIEQLQLDIDGLTELWTDFEGSAEEKAQLQSRIQSKIYQKQYQTAIQGQIDDVLKSLQNNAYKTISEYLDECYTDGYIGAFFDLHGQGIPLIMPLDQEAMVRAVQLDSKISEGLYNHLGENYNMLKKHITAQVSRGLANGFTFAQVAQQLTFKMSGTYNNPGGALAYAMRIARTEGHRIQVQGAMDACYKAKDMGADVVKQWDATLDGRTRASHSRVDGEIKELDEKFSNGLMFPGDPSGKAAEVINCRCALLERARWALDDSFTKMNNFTKEIETFESPAKYDEFKKAFFSKENKQFMNYHTELEERYGTKNFEKLLGGMSDAEHQHWQKLYNSNPIYNKAADGLTKSVNGDKISSKRDFKPIKGEHSISDDIGNKQIPTCNPNYKKGGDYSLNCGYCSATYEMRRRGYDVVANPKHGMLVTDWKKLFKDCKPIRLTSNRTDALAVELQTKLSALGDGARGSLFVDWKGNYKYGHFFSWEVENGKVRFIDGQTGETDVSRYINMIKPTKTVCLRWDDLEPSEMIKDACKNKGGG